MGNSVALTAAIWYNYDRTVTDGRTYRHFDDGYDRALQWVDREVKTSESDSIT